MSSYQRRGEPSPMKRIGNGARTAIERQVE